MLNVRRIREYKKSFWMIRVPEGAMNNKCGNTDCGSRRVLNGDTMNVSVADK